MCVAEHEDYPRKCSEAGRLREHRCSPSRLRSDTRGLYAALPHKDKGPPASTSTEQYQFQVNQPQCPARGAQTFLPVMRDLLWFSSLAHLARDPDKWPSVAVLLLWGAAVEQQENKTGGERICLHVLVHVLYVFESTWGGLWQTHRCVCTRWETMLDLWRDEGWKRRLTKTLYFMFYVVESSIYT